MILVNHVTNWAIGPLVLLTLISGISLVTSTEFNEQRPLPNGYFAFARAPADLKPPKVRKPPYLPISADCPGLHDSSGFISKNNLCGDINRGFIPRNPMGQYLLGQPYPFDLIKNKTLQFLSKTLPYLKDEIDSIPKVARFVKPSDFFENHSARYARSVSDSSGGSQGPNNTSDIALSPEGIPKVPELHVNSTKLSRQNGCEGNIVCETLETIKEEGILSKSFLGSLAAMASGGSLASLFDSSSQSTRNESSRTPNRKLPSLAQLAQLSQLLPSVSSISDNLGTSGVPLSGGEQPNVYSPLLSIIDYIQSLQTPKYATKRKSPTEPEDLLPEGPEKPQTPCLSSEEYVSPTYARNYMGVWKYVVQIPNEGYFTQTVQQTSCLKMKCDLIEGTCRESPRWVSLLVAEIFYPNVYFPVNQGGAPMLSMAKHPSQAATQTAPQHLQQVQPQSNAHFAQVVNSNHNQANKRGGSHSPASKYDLANMKRSDQQHQQELQNMQFRARRARTATEKGAPSTEQGSPDQEDGKEGHCDGFDKIGCYTVRVYYDWFLVNGSCKCWKSPNAGLNINETIKRIFIGKWKKK